MEEDLKSTSLILSFGDNTANMAKWGVEILVEREKSVTQDILRHESR